MLGSILSSSALTHTSLKYDVFNSTFVNFYAILIDFHNSGAIPTQDHLATRPANIPHPRYQNRKNLGLRYWSHKNSNILSIIFVGGKWIDLPHMVLDHRGRPISIFLQYDPPYRDTISKIIHLTAGNACISLLDLDFLVVDTNMESGRSIL